MLKSILLSAIILTCFTIFSFAQQKNNTLTTAEKKAGWKLLFNGKTIDGWRMYKNRPADSWSVKDGNLYCKGSTTDKSDKRADIITTDQYGDFELSVEWKISPQGNSGILYHVTEDFDASYLSGPEYQLIDDDHFPEKLGNWQHTAADYAMYPTSSRPTKPVGQYNVSKIIVKGAHREYWLNGVKVVEFDAWTDDWYKRKAAGKWKDATGYGMAKTGYICLQDHGSEMWFRNIKIRKL